MQMRTILNKNASLIGWSQQARRRCVAGALALAAVMAAPCSAWSQDQPGKRLAGIVAVAVDEYGKGVDSRGRVTNGTEYDEAVTFLGDAREVAGRLTGGHTALVRALVDTLAAAARAKVPPVAIAAIHQRLIGALGSDALLDLPTRRVDLAQGHALFIRNCAACHGAMADGNGPAAKALATAPPALADAKMRDVSPAAMYRIVSVGVAGTAMAGWASSLSTDERWDVVNYLASLRSSAAQVTRGEAVWRQRCATCAKGGASTLPAELGRFDWAAEKSDAQLALTVRDAGAATGSRAPLPDADVDAVIAYVRAMPAREAAAIASATPAGITTNAELAARTVLALLDEALAAARAGRPADAGDKAFDAYLAFEPLETRARVSAPGKVSALEASFAAFKGAVKLGNLASAVAARDSIAASLPQLVDLSQPKGDFWELFFQSFLIILREGFEAILVIGAIITFLVKTGHQERVRAVWKGVVAALVASGATAVALATMFSAIPASREIIEGITMLVAVLVLFSVSYWLISKVDASRWQQFIRSKVSTALEHGGGAALAFTAFLAVYREGAETALFYQALFQQPGAVALPLSLGLAAGVAALTVIFIGFHRFGVRVPMRPFFAATSGMLYLMAFVFMGKGIRELQEGNALTLTLLPGWPTVDALGIFPSREGLLAQGLLLVLLVYALYQAWRSARRNAAERAVSGDEVPQHVHVDLEGRVAELTARAKQLEQRVAMLEGELQREQEKRRSR